MRTLKFVFLFFILCAICFVSFQPNLAKQWLSIPEFDGQKPTILSAHNWKQWLDESDVMPSYQWRDLLEKSHTEPLLTAQHIKALLHKEKVFSSLDYAYLYVILYNLNLTFDEKWLLDAIKTIPSSITLINWMAPLLESEFALHSWHTGQRTVGYMLLEDSLKEVEKDNYMFLTPRLLNWLGRMALSENELLQAQKYLVRSIHLSKKHGDLLSQSKSHYNLHKMYSFMGQWEEALQHIKRARELHSRLPEPGISTQQIYWYNESVLYGYLLQVERATEAHMQAKKYFRLGMQTDRYRTLDIRSSANIALLNGDYDLAKSLINDCISLSQRAGFSYSQGRCYFKLAQLEMANENYSESLRFIDVSLEQFQKVNNAQATLKALKFKANIFDLSGDFVSAYALAKEVYRTEKSQLLDKLHDLTHAQESVDLTIQRDTLSKQAQQSREMLNRQSMYLTCAKWLGSLAVFVLICMQIRTYLVKRENLILENSSYFDQLTGLHNRNFYYLQLSNPERIKQEKDYHLAVFDIDHFKSINDSYGHLAGDEVLRQFALLVKSCLKEQELFVRWGGEEFLWLVQADEHTKERIERACKVVCNTPFITSKGELAVTTSIGVSRAALPEQILANERIFLEADSNLYQAKHAGRNQVVWSVSC
ncbi:tetratricopeptide repeat-containing diguanylate cyclase [Vibrio rhodolitus]|uniref:tetratricopeptide repeat-containing diguanylate cyclase n=1 Tax=Vibrio rhodolitus TaxID=2231649 RepID=UPI000E0A26D9|nr:GGDEF domain-containing protein [Vibrio rhodolitus]